MSQSVCVIVSVKTCETNEWQKTILRSHWEVNTIEPRKIMARKQRKPSQLYTEDDPQFGTWKPFSMWRLLISDCVFVWIRMNGDHCFFKHMSPYPRVYVCIQKDLPSRGLNWENKEEANLRLFLLFEKKKKNQQLFCGRKNVAHRD